MAQRVQIPFAFMYPATVSAQTVNEPVSGTTVTVTNRDTLNPATIFTAETGGSTIGTLTTNAAGNCPGWVVEGSYTVTAAAQGSFAGASIAWEAVRGDGVANVAPGAIGSAQIQAGAVGTTQLANNSVGTAQLQAASVTATQLASGAVLGAIGSLSGDLSGTLPSATVVTIGGHTPVTTVTTLGGVLSGTLPNPALASGAAATNVGTLSGDLSGTLPSPAVVAIRGRSVTSSAPSTGQVLSWNGTSIAWATISSGSASPSGPAGGGLSGTYPNPSLSSAAVQAAVGNATGGSITGTWPSLSISAGAVGTTQLSSSVQSQLVPHYVSIITTAASGLTNFAAPFLGCTINPSTTLGPCIAMVSARATVDKTAGTGANVYMGIFVNGSSSVAALLYGPSVPTVLVGAGAGTPPAISCLFATNGGSGNGLSLFGISGSGDYGINGGPQQMGNPIPIYLPSGCNAVSLGFYCDSGGTYTVANAMLSVQFFV